jgi:hypothetical protein
VERIMRKELFDKWYVYFFEFNVILNNINNN